MAQWRERPPPTSVARVRIAQSLRTVELDSTFRNGCGNEKKVEKCPLRGVLLWTIFRATCVATKLRDKLHESLPSVTPPSVLCV